MMAGRHMQINLLLDGTPSSALLHYALDTSDLLVRSIQTTSLREIDLDKLGNNFVCHCEATQLAHLDAGTFVVAFT